LKFLPLAGVEQYALSNGLDVLLKSDRRWPVFSFHVWVKVGSADEPEPRAGMAHILEHMVFKGTKRFRAEEISRFIESQGGVMNAETSKEYTHYYMDVPSAGAEKTVLLMSEMIHRATLDPDEWSRECPVILEEMKRRSDDPDVRLWDQFQDFMFDTPALRRAVIGTAETVSSVTINDLRDFYGRYYTAGQCVVSAAGDFDPAQMKKWIQKGFGDMPTGSPRRPRVWTPTRAQAREKAVQDTGVHQCYIAWGVPTPTAEHPDQEALDLLASVLSDGRNSRMVDILREKKRLVWSVHAMNYTQEGPGFFAVFAECEPAKRPAYRRLMESLIKDIQKTPPRDLELERSKNMIQNAWWQGWETAHNKASTLGHFAMDQQLLRFEKYMTRLLKVTPKDVQRVASTWLSQPSSTLWIEP